MFKDFILAIKHGLWAFKEAFKWSYASNRHISKGGCPDFVPNDKKPF